MADKKVAAGASACFCMLIVLLLVILYYPEPSQLDDDSVQELTPSGTLATWNNAEEKDSEIPESSLSSITKTLEELGISFLVLIAVICAAFGIACVSCACCCLL